MHTFRNVNSNKGVDWNALHDIMGGNWSTHFLNESILEQNTKGCPWNDVSRYAWLPPRVDDDLPLGRMRRDGINTELYWMSVSRSTGVCLLYLICFKQLQIFAVDIEQSSFWGLARLQNLYPCARLLPILTSGFRVDIIVNNNINSVTRRHWYSLVRITLFDVVSASFALYRLKPYVLPLLALSVRQWENWWSFTISVGLASNPF